MSTVVNFFKGVAANYSRKSQDQRGVAEDQKSIATQVDNARRAASALGCAITDADVFVDDAIGGAEWERREGLAKLVAAVTVKPRRYEWLVVSEVSRLGREAIETAALTKRIIETGVRIWAYLDNREVTMENATDSLLTFIKMHTASVERENTGKRTKASLERKARAGFVTGGKVFGYRNVEKTDAAGRRSHVEYERVDAQARIIVDIFERCVAGKGKMTIAKELNAEGVPSPRSGVGGGGWAGPTVGKILHRELYRGVMIWNKTKACDQFGKTLATPTSRPEHEHIQVPKPELRIVSDELWDAAHARLAATRTAFDRVNVGRPVGRPVLNPQATKHLLIGVAYCKSCGGNLEVKKRGAAKKPYYVCSERRRKGASWCSNDVPLLMKDGDARIAERLAEDFLTATGVAQVVARVAALLQQTEGDTRERTIVEQQLAQVEKAIANLVAAIMTADGSEALGAAIKAKEIEKRQLAERLAHLAKPAASVNVNALAKRIEARVAHYRRVLALDTAQARPALLDLLAGKLAFTPEVRDGQEGFLVEGKATWGAVVKTFVPAGAESLENPPVTTGYDRHGKEPVVTGPWQVPISWWIAA